jgi:hypothetical protein
MSYSPKRKLLLNRYLPITLASRRVLARCNTDQPTQTVASILQHLRTPEGDAQPTPADKLRLVLVFYLSVPDSAISKEDIAELEKELKNAGADVAAFDYVRKTREISRMTMSVPAVGGSSTPMLGSGPQGGEFFRGFSALGNQVCLSRGHFRCALTWAITGDKPPR